MNGNEFSTIAVVQSKLASMEESRNQTVYVIVQGH